MATVTINVIKERDREGFACLEVPCGDSMKSKTFCGKNAEYGWHILTNYNTDSICPECLESYIDCLG